MSADVTSEVTAGITTDVTAELGEPAPRRTTITQSRGAGFTRIASVGSFRPPRLVDNDEICQVLDSSDTWIRERTGIVTRRFAEPQQTVVDLAEPAARSALERAGMSAGDIDFILVATVTHLQQTPSAATLLAHRLGATPAAALDVSAACAGFCHAVSLADGLIRAGTATNVLVVGVEKLSDIVDPTDRSTAFIFGDGAGAIIISAVDGTSGAQAGQTGQTAQSDESGATGEELVGIGPTIWGSDGGRWDAIISGPYTDIRPAGIGFAPAAGPVDEVAGFDIGCDVSEAISSVVSTGSPVQSPWATGNWPTLRMKGQAVFRWAIWEMAPVARKAIEAAGIQPSDLVAFIPHQANLRIIDALAKQIGLPASVTIARDVVDMGNTSGASIPLAMDALLTKDPSLSGGLALLIGFGAGLSYAAQVVRLP